MIKLPVKWSRRYAFMFCVLGNVLTLWAKPCCAEPCCAEPASNRNTSRVLQAARKGALLINKNTTGTGFNQKRFLRNGLPIINLFVRSHYIPARSMEDTLQVNDRLLSSPLIYRLRAPHCGELVIFRAPATSLLPPDIEFVKRCVGVPGDVVDIRQRQFYRNGQLVKEPYVKWGSDSDLNYCYDMKIVHGKIYSRYYDADNLPGMWRVNEVPLTDQEQQRIERAAPEAIPPGQFLMLGDYRTNSNDSHSFGLVPRANIVSKAILIYAPPEHARKL